MTHDEGRMQKVWSFFSIKSEADTPLIQIKTGKTLKRGPKPLSPALNQGLQVPWQSAEVQVGQHCLFFAEGKTRNQQLNKP